MDTIPDHEPTPSPWRGRLACLTVALMPLSFNLGPYLDPQKKPLNFSPQDPLLGLLLALLLVDLARGRLRPCLPAWPNLLLGLFAAGSLGFAGLQEWRLWARSLSQMALVLLGWVWVFQHAVREPALLRRMALTLGASCGLCLLWALYQYASPQITPVRVSGWYEFRGQLAPLLAMLVPAAAAFAVQDRDPAVRVGAGALALVGLVVCLSGGGLLAAASGVLAVAAALVLHPALPAADGTASARLARREQGRQTRQGLLLFLALAALLLVVLPRLPRENPKILWRTLTLWAPPQALDTTRLTLRQLRVAPGADLERAAQVLKSLPGLKRLARLGESGNLEFEADEAGAAAAFKALTSSGVDLLAFGPLQGETERPTPRLRRSQAVWNLLLEEGRWRTGVGGGQFQRAVNLFYDPLAYPKPGARTDDEPAFDLEADEPYSFSLLETTAVEYGLPGLLALLWTFGLWIAAAAGALARPASATPGADSAALWRLLALASLGAAAGALAFALFGNPLIRGAGGVLAFWMGLALQARTCALPSPPPPRE